MISCKDVREPASGSQREAGTRTYKLRSRFNGRRRWPLHVRCRRKKFTFAISSADEFLSIGVPLHLCYLVQLSRYCHSFTKTQRTHTRM